MNTPLITAVHAQLSQATGEEAIVCASMALQMALLRGPKSAEAALKNALHNVLLQMPASQEQS